MALFNLDNPYEVEQFRTAVAEIERKGGYVELKRKHPQRTLQQNKYLHVLLGYFAQEFGYSITQVKQDIFKAECNSDIFYRLRVNKHGEEIAYIRSSAELTKDEMVTAIERFRNYSSAVCGLYLPSANEGDALMYAQQLIERNKEFL